MFWKILLILAVLSASGGASGCLANGGRTNPILAPITDGTGRSEGGGMPSSGMGGGDVSPTVTSEGGGDGAGGTTDGATTDTTSDAPIVVSGMPLGTTPGPHCSPQGTRLFFDAPRLAVSGRVDELGRREILVRSALLSQIGSVAPEPVGEKLVIFSDPNDVVKRYGSTATWQGCVFAKIYAPASLKAQVIRLSASLPLCEPERPDIAAEGIDSFAMYRIDSAGGGVPRGFWNGPTAAIATLDVTLPITTPESVLEDCDAFDGHDSIRENVLTDELMRAR